MNEFDQRRKAYEDKFMHDEKIRFKATVRALRSLLDWSVSKGFERAETQEYKDVMIKDLLMTSGVAVALTQLRDDMSELDQAHDFIEIENQFNTLLNRQLKQLAE